MYASTASMELSHLTIQPCEICLFFPFSLRETEWSSLRLSSSGLPGLKPRLQNPSPYIQVMWSPGSKYCLPLLFTCYLTYALWYLTYCVHRCCPSSSNGYIHSTKIYWAPVCHALLTTRHKSMLQSLYKLKAYAFSTYMDNPEIWVSAKLITISTQQV